MPIPAGVGPVCSVYKYHTTDSPHFGISFEISFFCNFEEAFNEMTFFVILA